MEDKVFNKPIEKQFEFDEEVASVFDDMLNRSVPFYKENLNLQIDILKNFLSDQDKIIDLGSSTGTFLIELAKKKENLDLIGIDNSEAMIKRAKNKARAFGVKVEFINSDFLEYDLSGSKAIVANYTVQFIRPLKREKLIKKIYDSLKNDGIFLMSEKLITENKKLNKIMIDIYYDYKKQMGYSEFEIAQKREALENVLIPYTMQENIEMLKNAGFKEIEVVFRWNNFATFIAFK
ncbi:putative methyltransferase [Nautilia profundicola AmH]|uniref:Carboxy-S-adenosyl-L-methionine synthase n=1 Tax=Nautilia profundicola (strain ATCC BAA-1463 / DSM 18972 / AmH) TaxID=598659 RepID=CMOA_NAUPA|nr:carboxy-S-adenosyl-L-methionine synthase CmoA [Nautilia profundicola]B9L9I3.1 RecName: Full=Carboxy-S-adenosyl-L-methionine synthase; Short=Cx-SAM synthase [Nautilia profundicola AmH]ACM92914.1 putative methyltransferase [Nautilia profundicola AmH]